MTALFLRREIDLALQRERLGHGQWSAWVAQNINFTIRTAQNYLIAYHTTVGAYRAQMRRPLPLSVEPTVEEITAAAAYAAERQGESNAKERPLAALYRETGVVEGNQNWGGKGRGQGRKAKAEQPSDVAGELCAEEGRDLIEELSGWALGADDGFGTLSDAELANAVQTLSQVLARAKAIQEARDVARKARA